MNHQTLSQVTVVSGGGITLAGILQDPKFAPLLSLLVALLYALGAAWLKRLEATKGADPRPTIAPPAPVPVLCGQCAKSLESENP